MRHLLTAALLLLAAPLAAQEFTTDAARQAKSDYEAGLQALKAKYSADLDDAAKVAVEAGELDEVVRIKETKEELAGTKPEKTGDRVLWKHKEGYFERLNDGHWIQRTPNGTPHIFTEIGRNEVYVELSRSTGVKTAVRLFNDRSEYMHQGERRFQKLFPGGWSPK